MIPVLTAEEMRSSDRRTIEHEGVPGALLMEAAGGAVADAVRRHYPEARRFLVLCGKGNNGGDGFVAARRLFAFGPVVALLGARGDLKEDSRLHLRALEEQGGSIEEIKDQAAWERFRPALDGADLVIDALLGTGLHEKPAGLMALAISDIVSRTGPRGIPVVSVDIPSGLSSDTPEVTWPTVSAAMTVTFAAPKVSLVLPPACDRCGRMVIADIGISRATIEASRPRLGLLEGKDVQAVYPPRDPDSHKGSYGHLLVVAGSLGKTGAAGLSAAAALRSGVGLVTVATASAAAGAVALWRAEAMTEALPGTAEGTVDKSALERALALARERDAAVIGPGLGQTPSTQEFVRHFVERCPVPLLVDADALNAIAALEAPARAPLLRRPLPTVLTPHPGEMGRLLGVPAQEVQGRRLSSALDLSRETGAVVVLKGRRTIVARPDGSAAINPTGNPGMATGGTGDVLAGMIGALLARGSAAWDAACAGVFLHGSAGDRASDRLGQESLLAMDVVDDIPGALRGLLERHG